MTAFRDKSWRWWTRFWWHNWVVHPLLPIGAACAWLGLVRVNRAIEELDDYDHSQLWEDYDGALAVRR